MHWYYCAFAGMEASDVIDEPMGFLKIDRFTTFKNTGGYIP
jgi:hypothetical protein